MTNQEIKDKAIAAYLGNKSAEAIKHFALHLPEASYQASTDRFILAGDSFCYKKKDGQFVLYNLFEDYDDIYNLETYRKYLLTRKKCIQEIDREYASFLQSMKEWASLL